MKNLAESPHTDFLTCVVRASMVVQSGSHKADSTRENSEQTQ